MQTKERERERERERDPYATNANKASATDGETPWRKSISNEQPTG